MWPFKKTNPPVSFPPASEAVFEKIHQFLKSDHIQLAKYPEQMRARLLAGTDTDQNEGAFGAFGRTITNPIPVNGPIGEIIYLSALRRGEVLALQAQCAARGNSGRTGTPSDFNRTGGIAWAAGPCHYLTCRRSGPVDRHLVVIRR